VAYGGRLVAGPLGARIGLVGGLAIAAAFVADTLGNAFDNTALRLAGRLLLPLMTILLALAIGAVGWQSFQWVRAFRRRAR